VDWVLANFRLAAQKAVQDGADEPALQKFVSMLLALPKSEDNDEELCLSVECQRGLIDALDEAIDEHEASGQVGFST
jgi:hypothetical protein